MVMAPVKSVTFPITLWAKCCGPVTILAAKAEPGRVGMDMPPPPLRLPPPDTPGIETPPMLPPDVETGMPVPLWPKPGSKCGHQMGTKTGPLWNTRRVRWS